MMPTSAPSNVPLRDAVRLELARETRVAGTDIVVMVHDGIVTLTGMVSRYVTKLAAQEVAQRVPGVRAVANDIAVQVPGAGIRTSADIACDVRRALAWDIRIPQERIQVAVSDGWVTLAGQVDRPQQRADAARAVRRLAGVCGVMNRIAVGEPMDAPGAVDGVRNARMPAPAGFPTVQAIP